MNCAATQRKLSAHLDGELEADQACGVERHLQDCARCAREFEALRATSAELRALSRLVPAEPIAARVRDRLEVESRGPGLALLFRPAWAARPLMLPSLVPAALLLACGLALLLETSAPPELPPVARGMRGPFGAVLPPAGTEANPLFPSPDVSAPVREGPGVSDDVLVALELGSDFFETVVARDGSVSTVVQLDGNRDAAGPLLDALRRERFEPARYQGRPVAVSVYRLISRLEVRASRT